MTQKIQCRTQSAWGVLGCTCACFCLDFAGR